MRNQGTTELDRCRELAKRISPYLYSVAEPPAQLNRLFIDWIERGIVPTKKALADAIKADSRGIA